VALAINDTHERHTDGVSHGVTVPIAILLLAIGIVGFFLLQRSVATHQGAATLDMPVLQWMVSHRSGTLTMLMQAVTNVLAPAAVGIGALLIGVVWAWRKRELWRPILFLGGIGLTFAVSSYVKHAVHRGRPPAAMMLPPPEADFSFPSGHTVGVAIIALLLTYLLCSRAHKLWKTLVWLLVSISAIALIAFSRMYLGYHWVTDVSASVCIAFVVTAIIMLVDGIPALFGRRS